MKTVEINIDAEKACKECGQLGATDSGICLECAIPKDSNIHLSLKSAISQINALVLSHEASVEMAYLNSKEDKVSIGLSIELSPSNEKPDTILVKTKINFIESRIKDEMSEQVSNRQGKLNI